MPRRRSPEKRKILPDPKYKDIIVAKFMNHIMKDGKKSVAEKIVYGAFNKIDETAKTDPVELFKKALDTIGPMVEVKSRRVGGATYQVPIEVRPSRRQALAMRWLVEAAGDGRVFSNPDEVLRAYESETLDILIYTILQSTQDLIKIHALIRDL